MSSFANNHLRFINTDGKWWPALVFDSYTQVQVAFQKIKITGYEMIQNRVATDWCKRAFGSPQLSVEGKIAILLGEAEKQIIWADVLPECRSFFTCLPLVFSSAVSLNHQNAIKEGQHFLSIEAEDLNAGEQAAVAGMGCFPQAPASELEVAEVIHDEVTNHAELPCQREVESPSVQETPPSTVSQEDAHESAGRSCDRQDNIETPKAARSLSSRRALATDPVEETVDIAMANEKESPQSKKATKKASLKKQAAKKPSVKKPATKKPAPVRKTKASVKIQPKEKVVKFEKERMYPLKAKARAPTKRKNLPKATSKALSKDSNEAIRRSPPRTAKLKQTLPVQVAPSPQPKKARPLTQQEINKGFSVPDQSSALKLLKKLGYTTADKNFACPATLPANGGTSEITRFRVVGDFRRHLCRHGVVWDGIQELSEEKKEMLSKWIRYSICSDLRGRSEIPEQARSPYSSIHAPLLKLGFQFLGGVYYFPKVTPKRIGGISMNGFRMDGEDGLHARLCRFGLPASCDLKGLSKTDLLRLQLFLTDCIYVNTFRYVEAVDDSPFQEAILAAKAAKGDTTVSEPSQTSSNEGSQSTPRVEASDSLPSTQTPTVPNTLFDSTSQPTADQGSIESDSVSATVVTNCSATTSDEKQAETEDCVVQEESFVDDAPMEEGDDNCLPITQAEPENKQDVLPSQESERPIADVRCEMKGKPSSQDPIPTKEVFPNAPTDDEEKRRSIEVSKNETEPVHLISSAIAKCPSQAEPEEKPTSSSLEENVGFSANAHHDEQHFSPSQDSIPAKKLFGERHGGDLEQGKCMAISENDSVSEPSLETFLPITQAETEEKPMSPPFEETTFAAAHCGTRDSSSLQVPVPTKKLFSKTSTEVQEKCTRTEISECRAKSVGQLSSDSPNNTHGQKDNEAAHAACSKVGSMVSSVYRSAPKLGKEASLYAELNTTLSRVDTASMRDSVVEKPVTPVKVIERSDDNFSPGFDFKVDIDEMEGKGSPDIPKMLLNDEKDGGLMTQKSCEEPQEAKASRALYTSQIDQNIAYSVAETNKVAMEMSHAGPSNGMDDSLSEVLPHKSASVVNGFAALIKSIGNKGYSDADDTMEDGELLEGESIADASSPTKQSIQMAENPADESNFSTTPKAMLLPDASTLPPVNGSSAVESSTEKTFVEQTDSLSEKNANAVAAVVNMPPGANIVPPKIVQRVDESRATQSSAKNVVDETRYENWINNLKRVADPRSPWIEVESKMKAYGMKWGPGSGLSDFTFYFPGRKGRHGTIGYDYVNSTYDLKKFARENLCWEGDEKFKAENIENERGARAQRAQSTPVIMEPVRKRKAESPVLGRQPYSKQSRKADSPRTLGKPRLTAPEKKRTVGEKLDACTRVLQGSRKTKTLSIVEDDSSSKFKTQVDEIQNFLNNAIPFSYENIEDSSYRSILYICGSPGVGKTSTVEWCCSQAEGIWCNITGASGDAKAVWSAIGERFGLKKAPSISSFRSFLERSADVVTLVIDEIDNLVSSRGVESSTRTTGERLVEELCSLAADRSLPFILIGISNAVDTIEARRLRFIGMNGKRITFAPYSQADLIQMVVSRIGNTIVDEKALAFIAARVASGSGDARKMMELVSVAITHRKKSISASSLCQVPLTNRLVSIRDAVQAVKASAPEKYTKQIETLPDMAKIVLCVAVTICKIIPENLTLAQLKTYCSQVTKEECGDNLDFDTFSMLIQNLVDQGLLMPNRDGESAINSQGYSAMLEKCVHFGAQLQDVESAVLDVLTDRPIYQRLIDRIQSTIGN